MSILVKRVSSLRQSDFSNVDFSLTVSNVANVPFTDTALGSVSKISPYRKSYHLNLDLNIEGAAYSVIITAKSPADNLTVGYMVASLAWNNCVQIDEFAVDREHRGMGIGKSLMDELLKWTSEKQFGIIRLETQNTNVPACRFYERYGFKLGGYDRHLYDAINKDNIDEIALYYYLHIGN